MYKEVFYKFNTRSEEPLLKYWEDDLVVKRVKPRMLSSLHAFLWTIETLFFGSYVEYQLWRGDKLVSKDDVVSWIPQFAFMPKNGIHIGPCYTMKDERGHGYYPYLLDKIVNDNSLNECFMIVSPSNTPSIRGIEKAGFEKYGFGRRTRLGIYVIENK